MKKIYWTAYKSHPLLMTLLCLVALICLATVEKNKQLVPRQHYVQQLKAAQLSQMAFNAVKKQRLKLGYEIDKKLDPSESGLIGKRDTIITSLHGVLRSKQISVNPNLAALILQWVIDLKLQKGDVVAVGMTGSFPALNIDTLAVLQIMELKPILIVSATSSQWGANIPDFSWIDMLHLLNEKNIITTKPIAASIGAQQDLGKNLDKRGIKTILASLKRYNIPLIQEPLVSLSINKRLNLYQQAADGKAIKAYINLGGGSASIGRHLVTEKLSQKQKRMVLSQHLKAGVNLELPIQLAHSNSVAVRYLKEGVPVINIRRMSELRTQYDLRLWKVGMGVGTGSFFFHERYNIWYAGISLLIIILACWVEIQMQFKKKHTNHASARHEQT